jgi:hypothetical protein
MPTDGLPRRLVAFVTAAVTGGTLVVTGLTVVAPATAAPAVPLSDCVSSDNGDPVLSGLTISTHHLDIRRKARTVTFRVAVTDSGGPGPASGIAAVSVDLVAPQDSSARGVVLHPTTDGGWTAVKRYRPGALGIRGTWQATVSVRDKAGNITTARPADLMQLGSDPTLRVRTVEDHEGPVVTDVRLSKKTVDTTDGSRRLRVSVDVRDALSGVSRVRFSAYGSHGGVSSSRMGRTAGTVRNGTWSAIVYVPRGTGSGRWPLHVSVRDGWGTPASYGPKRLARISADSALRVTGVLDDRPPALKDVSLTPNTIDVREQDAIVTVELHATDALAGVSGGQLRALPGVLGAPLVGTLRLISGTRRDGVWRASATFSHCRAVTGTAVFEVAVWSIGTSAGVRLDDQPLHVTAGDTKPPGATVLALQQNAGPVRVAFDEPVTGISPESALLVDGNGTAVAGTWTCHDITGAATDCFGTATREARFSPAAALVTAATYRLVLNPEHVLDVRDLAGLPPAIDRLPVPTMPTG